MYYIGLDIGGTKCAATLGKIVEERIEILDKEFLLTSNQEPYVVLRIFSEFI